MEVEVVAGYVKTFEGRHYLKLDKIDKFHISPIVEKGIYQWYMFATVSGTCYPLALFDREADAQEYLDLFILDLCPELQGVK